MDDGVSREVKIHAPAATIFEYFTDPAKAVRWNCVGAELDPRPGGLYRVQVTPEWFATGEFVELDPPRRIVHTWGWEGDPVVPPGSSTVEITLEEDGEYTIVRILHRGLGSDDSRAQHEEGWAHYLERLSIAAAGGDPGPDPWAQAQEA